MEAEGKAGVKGLKTPALPTPTGCTKTQGAILLTGNVHSPGPAAPTAATRNQYRVPLIIVLTVTFVLVGVATVT